MLLLLRVASREDDEGNAAAAEEDEGNKGKEGDVGRRCAVGEYVCAVAMMLGTENTDEEGKRERSVCLRVCSCGAVLPGHGGVWLRLKEKVRWESGDKRRGWLEVGLLRLGL